MSHRSRRRARRPPPPAAPATRGRAWPIAALLLIAGFAVYGVGLSYPFVLDDSLSIVNNPSIRDLWSVRVFTPGREAPASGRPLVNLSNAVNFAAGGLDPLGYRLVNLGLHLLCAFVLFATIRRTLELPRLPAAVRSRARQIAAASALLWMAIRSIPKWWST